MASPDRERVLDRLRRMDEYEFEHLVADLWEHRGWTTEVTQGSNDRGIDVVATKRTPFSQKQLIQAKRYGEGNKIGSPAIQQYSSLRHQEADVDAIVVVSTSSFTPQAEQAARDLNVKLIDGESLYDLVLESGAESVLGQYVSLGSAASDVRGGSAGTTARSSPFADASAYTRVTSNQGYVDACPDCDAEAVWFGERRAGYFLKCANCDATWGVRKSGVGTVPFDSWQRVAGTDADVPTVEAESRASGSGRSRPKTPIPHAAYNSTNWARTKLSVAIPFLATGVVALWALVVPTDAPTVVTQLEDALVLGWYLAVLGGAVAFVVYASRDKRALDAEGGDARPRHPVTLGVFLVLTGGLYALNYLAERSHKHEIAAPD